MNDDREKVEPFGAIMYNLDFHQKCCSFSCFVGINSSFRKTLFLSAYF